MKFSVNSFKFLVNAQRGNFAFPLKTQNSKHKTTRGFTLIEMLVVTGIITIVSGLVLANNNRFGGVALLQNIAYDIALTIRKAQVYGISVARFGNVYAPAYGMHFQPNTNPNAQDSYALFADVNRTTGEGTYDDSSELMQEMTIMAGYHIQSLCATPAGAAEVCDLAWLDISFQRPEPDAYIRAGGLPGINESARIILSSPRGITKSVTVEVNGQISVE